MDSARLKQLLARYKDGEYTEAEAAELLRYLGDAGNGDTLAQLAAEGLFDSKYADTAATTAVQQRLTHLFEEIAQKTNPAPRRLSPWRVWLTAAAMLLAFLSIGLYIWRSAQPVAIQLSSQYGEDAAPGGNRATLTLADGRVVALSEAQEGIVIGERGLRYNDGSVILSEGIAVGTSGAEGSRPIGTDSSTPFHSAQNDVRLMSITTPKGGTYTVTLPDGSKVWLNAGSTLKYPSSFDRDERIVELTGEAYFEVTRSREVANTQSRDGSVATQRLSDSATQPFRVVSKGQTVEVLGTTFNISAYPEDAEIKTTLVEGKVQVSVSPSDRHPPVGGQVPERGSSSESARSRRISSNVLNSSISLVPGEQVTLSGSRLAKRKVNTAPYTAWMRGEFVFHHASLAEILPQLARWYDITVDIAPIPQVEFYAEISRDMPLSTVLAAIEETSDIRFEIKERRLRLKK